MVEYQALGHQVTLALAALLMFAAAASDARRFRIPNLLNLGLLLLFPLFVLTAPQPILWQSHLVVFVSVLAVGFAFFAKNIAGAGDVKLLAVISLWSGPHLLGIFLFVTALAGGLLALAVGGLAAVRRRMKKEDSAKPLAQTPLPYGVAIAIGGLCTLVMLSHPGLLPV